MTARPLLLHPTEIRATQIRRVCKVNEFSHRRIELVSCSDGVAIFRDRVSAFVPQKCPFGKAGDQLWAKETYVIESNHYAASATEYPPPFNDGRPTHWQSDGESTYWQQCHYRATDPEPALHYGDLSDPHCRWRPPLTMPRWASRLTLELLSVRVERLQAITEEEAKAAGAEGLLLQTRRDGHYEHVPYTFQRLWDARNASHPWSSDPWVWVLDVRKV